MFLNYKPLRPSSIVLSWTLACGRSGKAELGLASDFNHID